MTSSRLQSVRPQPTLILPSTKLHPKQQAAPQQSRTTDQVIHVAPPVLHQDSLHASLAPPAHVDSDSDTPLVSRRDLPKVERYRRGSALRADDAARDATAVKRLVRDKVANSSIGAARTRASWWPSRARARGIAPFPLTPNKVRLAAALLKQAGYRSAPGYLSGAKRRHIELGYRWDDQLS